VNCFTPRVRFTKQLFSGRGEIGRLAHPQRRLDLRAKLPLRLEASSTCLPVKAATISPDRVVRLRGELLIPPHHEVSDSALSGAIASIAARTAVRLRILSPPDRAHHSVASLPVPGNVCANLDLEGSRSAVGLGSGSEG
jgi:hypothetical protein